MGDLITPRVTVQRDRMGIPVTFMYICHVPENTIEIVKKGGGLLISSVIV